MGADALPVSVTNDVWKSCFADITPKEIGFTARHDNPADQADFEHEYRGSPKTLSSQKAQKHALLAMPAAPGSSKIYRPSEDQNQNPRAVPMAKKRDPKKRLPRELATKKIEREKYLSRLEHLMLRGVTNQHELAAAFGLSVQQIKRDMVIMRERWLNNSPKGAENAKVTRIRQLERLARLALNSYHRSRQDVDEITSVKKRCLGCGGTGKIDRKSAPEEDCGDCGGTGVMTVETRRVKGQAGDASFLKMAKECFVEAGKIEGVVTTASLTMKNLAKVAGELPDGQVKMESTELLLEAPIDVLIRAKALLEEIEEGRKAGTITVVEGKTQVSRRPYCAPD